MGIEKEGSKNGAGYVGGFLHLFDWTAKSRKKLFPSKSDLPGTISIHVPANSMVFVLCLCCHLKYCWYFHDGFGYFFFPFFWQSIPNRGRKLMETCLLRGYVWWEYDCHFSLVVMSFSFAR